MFLLTGLVSWGLPDLLDTLVSDVGPAVAVVLAAPPDRTYGADLPLPVRVVVAVVATFLGAIPAAIGPVLLVVPGVYVGVRLFLATPTVMLDGHGPIYALRRSWNLMEGMVLATFLAMVAIFAAGVAVGAPVLFLTRSEVLLSVVLSLVVGAPAVGAQAYLYAELTG